MQSHTATQQWQSFEIRMRRRRVERCILRASVAIEAGVLDGARAALEEVEQLDPYEPALETLRAQLATAEAADLPLQMPVASLASPSERATPLVPVAPRHSHPLRYAAAVLLIALSGVAGWSWVATTRGAPAAGVQGDTSGARPPAASPMSQPSSQPSVRVSETAVTAVTELDRPPADIAPTATTGSGLVASNPTSHAEPPATAPAAPDDSTPAVRAALTAPDSGSVPIPAAALEGPRPLIALRDAAPEPAPPPPAVPGIEGTALSDTTVTLAPPAPALAQPQSEERMVRATLSRYEGAYSSLDASAARSVWPGVDQRALASAFQGLSSQSVSLGRCDVRIAGATARADCAGTARWTPKVGGGPQSAGRRWQFELRNTGSEWIITSATVR